MQFKPRASLVSAIAATVSVGLAVTVPPTPVMAASSQQLTSSSSESQQLSVQRGGESAKSMSAAKVPTHCGRSDGWFLIFRVEPTRGGVVQNHFDINIYDAYGAREGDPYCVELKAGVKGSATLWVDGPGNAWKKTKKLKKGQIISRLTKLDRAGCFGVKGTLKRVPGSDASSGGYEWFCH